MSRSGNSWRAKAGALAMLLPLLALAACANNNDAMNEKLAAAEAAAEKAIAAQHAAEKAAATAASIRPASAPAPEPVVSDADSFDSDSGDDSSDNHNEPEVSLAGEGQTVTADNVVVPGQGA